MKIQALRNEFDTIDTFYGVSRARFVSIGQLELPSLRMYICGPEAIGSPEFAKFSRPWQSISAVVNVTAAIVSDGSETSRLGLIEFAPPQKIESASENWKHVCGPVYIERVYQDMFIDANELKWINDQFIANADAYWDYIQQSLRPVDEGVISCSLLSGREGRGKTQLLMETNDENGMIAGFASTDGRFRVLYHASLRSVEIEELRRTKPSSV